MTEKILAQTHSSMLNYYTKHKLLSFVYHLIMIALSFTMAYPFVWAVMSSFKTSGQMFAGNPLTLIPRPFTLINYERTLELLPFGMFMRNSLVLSLAIPALMILFSSLCAYGLSRLEFRGRNFIFMLFVSTMMVPSHVTLIPNYLIVSRLGWIDSYVSLFVNAIFTGVNAFNIFSSVSSLCPSPKTWSRLPSLTDAVLPACISASSFPIPNRRLQLWLFCPSAQSGTPFYGRCWSSILLKR